MGEGEEKGEEKEEGSVDIQYKPFSVTGESDWCACSFQPFCIKVSFDQPRKAEEVSGPRATARVCGCPLVPEGGSQAHL